MSLKIWHLLPAAPKAGNRVKVDGDFFFLADYDFEPLAFELIIKENLLIIYFFIITLAIKRNFILYK